MESSSGKLSRPVPQAPTDDAQLRQSTINHQRRAVLFVAALFAVLAAMMSSATPAFADHGITTTGDVNLRSGPGTQHQIIDVVPGGTSPNYQCYSVGEDVNGVDVWMKVEYNGQVGFISSFFDDSSYSTNEEVASKYGIPSCDTADATPAVTGTPTSCYGDYCSGQDPVTSGCGADAVTIYALDSDTGGGRLELRWSPNCKTNWTRWQQYPTGWCMNCSPLAILAEQDTGYTQKLVFFEGDGGQGMPTEGTYWTPMIYSPEHAVKAVALMPCGDMTLIGSAFDCAMSGRIETQAG